MLSLRVIRSELEKNIVSVTLSEGREVAWQLAFCGLVRNCQSEMKTEHQSMTYLFIHSATKTFVLSLVHNIFINCKLDLKTDLSQGPYLNWACFVCLQV